MFFPGCMRCVIAVATPFVRCSGLQQGLLVTGTATGHSACAQRVSPMMILPLRALLDPAEGLSQVGSRRCC